MLWSMETHAKDTYSTAQAAKLLRVNDRTIRKMLDRGELDGEREESGAWRVLQTSVHARLEELRRREAEEGREESWESLERLRELEVEVRDSPTASGAPRPEWSSPRRRKVQCGQSGSV